MKINSISQQNNYQTATRSTTTKNSTPAFKGPMKNAIKPVTDFAFKNATKVYSGVAKSNPFQKLTSFLAKSDKSFTNLMVAESAWLSGFYMINTLKNKKIEKEQKPQMLINDALVWGVSTAGAYLVDGKVTNFVTKQAENYVKKHDNFYSKLGQKAKEASQSELASKITGVLESGKDKLDDGLKAVADTISVHLKDKVSPEKLTSVQESVRDTITSGISGNKDDVINAIKDKVDDAYEVIAQKTKAAEIDKLKSGFGKMRTLIIVGLMYRFMGPVIVTPIANKLSKKLATMKQEKAAQKASQTEKTK